MDGRLVHAARLRIRASDREVDRAADLLVEEENWRQPEPAPTDGEIMARKDASPLVLDVLTRVSRTMSREGDSYGSPEVQRADGIRWVEQHGHRARGDATQHHSHDPSAPDEAQPLVTWSCSALSPAAGGRLGLLREVSPKWLTSRLGQGEPSWHFAHP